jgi:hypothetical protein
MRYNNQMQKTGKWVACRRDDSLPASDLERWLKNSLHSSQQLGTGRTVLPSAVRTFP